MNLRQLRYFVVVSDLESVTRASERLHVAQPALTRHIRALERGLGVQLFAKKGRGIVLTEAGSVFRDRVRTILQEIDQAQVEVRKVSRSTLRRVNVGLPHSISQALTRVLLERVPSLCRGVTVRVVDGWSGFIVEYLLRERFDLGVIYDHTPGSEQLYTEPLAAEEQFLVCAPKLRPRCCPISLAEVARLPLVLPSHEHGLRVAVEKIAFASGLELNIRAEIESMVAIRQSALAGENYAILPHPEIADDVAAGRLAAIKIVEPQVQRTLFLAWQKTHPVEPPVRRVIELLKRETATLIEQGRWATRYLGTG